ncbi:hypothetical protein BU14_0032s0005 [Porphyra umbilicalis]|uniref:Uncharacterized protein n=1 Tax=Porphyra umbilicalis TaxID=2786 RepID=A0A1X6PIT1_PORUM|nr:hypothetical protein BU14_0032s0005 [Porphyra umbilicalis]|eukprot:OSX80747.1 hypothetical protein BU14_0032s0005 [Porphyra umbilicalis]
MTGGDAPPVPPSSTAVSEKAVLGDILGSERSLSRGGSAAMETTVPPAQAANSTPAAVVEATSTPEAAVGSTPAAAVESTPAGVGTPSGPPPPAQAQASVADQVGPSGSAMEDVPPAEEVPPISRRVLLLPPQPRGQAGAPRVPGFWPSPALARDMPDCDLRDAYLAIPEEARRTELWDRRARRFPSQAPLPAGVNSDLPALLRAEEAGQVVRLSALLTAAVGEMEVDDVILVVCLEWFSVSPPCLGGEDAHNHHGVVREEHRSRKEFLVHRDRTEFVGVPEEKRASL